MKKWLKSNTRSPYSGKNWHKGDDYVPLSKPNAPSSEIKQGNSCRQVWTGLFCVPGFGAKLRSGEKTKASCKAEHQVITQMPGNEYLRVQVGQVKSRKLNPIFSSVPSLRLQPRPQIRRRLLFTLVLSLVNIVVHQEFAVAQRPGRKRRSRLRCGPKLLVSFKLRVVCTSVFRVQWLLWVSVPCEGPVCVELPVDADLPPLSQQVRVDQRVLNGGVLMGIVVFVCFWEAVVSWQEAGAVWIVDGHLMIQLLLLLPVWEEKQDDESFIHNYQLTS